MSTDPRFPLGKFSWPQSVTEAELKHYIDRIAAQPANLRAAVAGLTQEQLDTPYREWGWTVRQVVHHIPESHMHSFIRFKLALTEDKPTVKPYDEDAWGKLGDIAVTPIEVSMRLLDALHERWVDLMHVLTPEQWKREFVHPELGVISLDKQAALYAWHGDHHIAHITELRKHRDW